MATLEQERHAELVSGTTEKFLITSRMVAATIPDQLPHLNVFVLTINDREDPKQDSLVRVARIADLTALPQGRDAALESSTDDVGIEFLSSSSITMYSTLSEASTAAIALKDRVNQLIIDWVFYEDDFAALDPTPASYLLPSVDPSQLQALINAYTVAKQSRYTKTLEKNEADAVLARTTATFTDAQQRLTDVEAALTKATLNDTQINLTKTYFETIILAGGALSSYVNPLIVYLSGGGVDAPGQASLDAAVATYDAAHAIAVAQASLVTNYLLDAAAIVTLLTSLKTAFTTVKNAASTALSTATADQVTKTQSLATTTAAETAALLAILAVCPDFDKHSIPFVPDTEP